MSLTLVNVGEGMTFYMYIRAWMYEYPHLDVYHHMQYIERAYAELYLEEGPYDTGY